MVAARKNRIGRVVVSGRFQPAQPAIEK